MKLGSFRALRAGAFLCPENLRAIGFVALFLAGAGLSGCADISRKFADVGSKLPAVGLTADAPERPAQAAPYPAVHDIPPPRNSVTLTNFEQQRMEDDLVVARDKQEASAGVAPQPKRARDKDQTPKVRMGKPVSSGASIY
jgi:hypothetical protein